jgi:hypothetical protein
MKNGKDSREVVEFMALLHKLREKVNYDSSELELRAKKDASLKRLCIDIYWAGFAITMNERRQRRLFTAPVDPEFVSSWRTYEQNFAVPVSRVFLSDFDPESLSYVETRSRAAVVWDNADDHAQEQAASIEAAIDFALDQASQDWRDFPDGFRAGIEDGNDAWSRLKEETGFDLRGVFRRRELVPFVLIPRHVSQRHGENEKLSLLTHLQEAHDAFVFGLNFAALTLMRSVLEATLKFHYKAPGKDLKERIENCECLPVHCSKIALHRIRSLANEILHFEKDAIQLPKSFEQEILRLLNVLRGLIEGAPSSKVE